jgi:hypothetical protein
MGMIGQVVDRWWPIIPPPIFCKKGGPLGFWVKNFEISKLMKFGMVVHMGSENNDMTLKL